MKESRNKRRVERRKEGREEGRKEGRKEGIQKYVPMSTDSCLAVLLLYDAGR